MVLLQGRLVLLPFLRLRERHHIKRKLLRYQEKGMGDKERKWKEIFFLEAILKQKGKSSKEVYFLKEKIEGEIENQLDLEW